MNSEPRDGQDQPPIQDAPAPARSGRKPMLSLLLVVVLTVCVCIAVLTLLGPVIGNTRNTILGVPNGAPE